MYPLGLGHFHKGLQNFKNYIVDANRGEVWFFWKGPWTYEIDSFSGVSY